MGGGGEQPWGAPSRRNRTWGPPPIRPPPFLISGGGKERGERGKEGGILFPLFPFLLPFSFLHLGRPIWGCTRPLGAGLSRPWPNKAHIFAGGCPKPLPVTRYVPGTPGTLPVSEYYRPIYEYLPLDHFETPRHVRDLIRDSEQHSVTKSHNSYNTQSSSNVKRADPTGSRTM